MMESLPCCVLGHGFILLDGHCYLGDQSTAIGASDRYAGWDCHALILKAMSTCVNRTANSWALPPIFLTRLVWESLHPLRIHRFA